MNLVEGMQSFLAELGLVDGSTGWTSVRRRMADALGDKLVVLSEDGGPLPEVGTDEGIGSAALREQGVQIMVRAEPWDGDASLAKATEIRDALHGLRDVEIGSGTRYIRVRARTAAPIFAGFDEKGRPIHTVSVLALERQAAPTTSF